MFSVLIPHNGGMSYEVLVIPRNHFDPVWRRGFRTSISRQGTTIAPYAVIEERAIDEWLARSARGFTVSESQAAVWREYLARNPERFEQLRAEVQAGRLCVQLGGETVQDSNLPAAEGLVRNFLVALPLYRELCGEDHPGLEIAWIEDAFGNSPNYPQILAGCGAKVAARMSYRSIDGELWTALDGTVLPVLDRLPVVSEFQFMKHPPCPACHGVGCAGCAGSGIRWLPNLQQPAIEAVLEQAIANDRARRDGSYGRGTAAGRLDGVAQMGTVVLDQAPDQMCAWSVVLGGEETFPNDQIEAAMAAVAARHPDYRPRFATEADQWLLHRTRLTTRAATAQQAGSAPSCDLNPAMPGCMVSRHTLKSRPRILAHRLVSAEARLACAQWANGENGGIGAPAVAPMAWHEAWRHITFAQFHDAITGTSLDGVCSELHDMLDQAETLIGPVSRVDSPLRASGWQPVLNDSTLTWGELTLTVDLRGIRSLAHGDAVICTERQLSLAREPLRVAELTLEEDFGDAWGTRIAPIVAHAFIPLSDYHTTVEGHREVGGAITAVRWQGLYTGDDRKVEHLAWTITATPSNAGTGVELAINVDWNTESRRLRLRVPVAGESDQALYEVPFGHLARRHDPTAYDYSIWKAHQNEYPMHHWIRANAETSGVAGAQVALLAADLPCARWTPGMLDLSLLRSPESGFCHIEVHNYEFHDIDGLRDSGQHTFQVSLRADCRGLSTGDLSRLGYALFRPDFPELPFSITGDVAVDAFKPAEDGNAWILRLHDTSGYGGPLRLDFTSTMQVTPCDLLERPGRTGSNGTPSTGKSWSTAVRPHGILTLRITPR